MLQASLAVNFLKAVPTAMKQIYLFFYMMHIEKLYIGCNLVELICPHNIRLIRRDNKDKKCASVFPKLTEEKSFKCCRRKS